MSGFEVVGAVLGTLPLAISALEHYRDGLRAIQRWRRYERELQSLIRNLETERAKLQNVCEKLLSGLVPPSSIESMVDDPLGKLWLEESTQRRVRMRLWRNWNIFEENLVDMNTAISRLRETIGDTSEVNSSKSSNLSIVRELKRATFALDRSAYADLLSTIRDGVSNLEALVSSNIELEPERRVRSRVRLLSIIRSLSLGIYRATRSGFSQCICKHDVGLQLAHHSAYITPDEDDESIAQRLKFQAALSHQVGVPGQVPLPGDEISWDQVTVEMVPASAPPPIPATSPPAQALSSKPPNKKIRSVKFASFQTSASFTSSGSGSSDQSPGHSTQTTLWTSQVANLALAPIQPALCDPLDLCKSLKMFKQGSTGSPDCYGTILDKGSLSTKHCRFAFYPSRSVDVHLGSCKMLSLQEILAQRDPKSKIHGLSYRDRLQLAVFVASSLLQLYNTPWLSDLLTSDKVFFMVRGGPSGLIPSSEQVFFIASTNHRSPPSPPTTAGPSAFSPGQQPASGIRIRNPTLLALGILLVEIITGQTIDSLNTSSEDDEKGINPPAANASADAHARLLSNYIVAHRMLSQIYQASSNYGSAVRRCINGDFSVTGKHDLEDEDFRQAVYSGVVRLLEEDLSHT